MNHLKDKVRDMTTTQVMNAVFCDIQTGCLNRRAFEETKSEAVVLVDVDSLKWVNDNLGHSAGDRLLRYVARELQATFGEQDVYRLSGDEFAVHWTMTSDLTSGMRDVSERTGCISFGIGANLDMADDALKTSKDQRLVSGARAPRGEQPAWAGADWLARD